MSITGIVALINFFVFVFVSQYLGGDALNGYIKAGHYFVCAHGGCAEVSASVWKYSYWHALVSMWGILLIFIEAALFVTTGDIVLDFK